MDELYREQILEHYKRPHNWGELDAPEFAVRSKDEIGVLAESFARMRKSLVHAMKLLDT